jgi:hypothetical protein
MKTKEERMAEKRYKEMRRNETPRDGNGGKKKEDCKEKESNM